MIFMNIVPHMLLAVAKCELCQEVALCDVWHLLEGDTIISCHDLDECEREINKKHAAARNQLPPHLRDMSMGEMACHILDRSRAVHAEGLTEEDQNFLRFLEKGGSK